MSDYDEGETAKHQGLLFALGDLRTKEAPRAGTPEADLDKYLARTIRRVTLFFSEAEYAKVISDLMVLGKKFGTENHTDTVRRLIDENIER